MAPVSHVWLSQSLEDAEDWSDLERLLAAAEMEFRNGLLDPDELESLASQSICLSRHLPEQDQVGLALV